MSNLRIDVPSALWVTCTGPRGPVTRNRFLLPVWFGLMEIPLKGSAGGVGSFLGVGRRTCVFGALCTLELRHSLASFFIAVDVNRLAPGVVFLAGGCNWIGGVSRGVVVVVVVGIVLRKAAFSWSGVNVGRAVTLSISIRLLGDVTGSTFIPMLVCLPLVVTFAGCVLFLFVGSD